MTIDEAIMQCEEAAEDRAKLSKRYDDASGYSRSHNEAIRTNDAKECEKCSQDFIQLAGWLRELKQLREQTRWIPISERLPEQGREVICQCRANIINVLKLDACGDWCQNANRCYTSGFVIAWMPLPEPYKAESEGER